MRLLGIDTDPLLTTLMGDEHTPSEWEFLDFQNELNRAFALFLHDRMYELQPKYFLFALNKFRDTTAKYKRVFSSVPDELAAAVDQIEQAQMGSSALDSAVLDRLRETLDEVSGYLDQLISEESGRGRQVDRPSFNLVSSLADIYHQLTGKPPTFGNSEYKDGVSATPFGSFVDEAVKALKQCDQRTRRRAR